MSPAHDDDAVPRDAWLREALRHAPDAQAGPPPKLEQTILRMGRAAVAPRMERPAASPAGPGAFAAFWAWLARPPVAAGFAALMVATVVGVMWWDRPLDDALPPREETVAVSPAPSTAEAPALTSATSPGLPEAAKRAAAAPPADTVARKSSTTAAMPKAEAPPPAPLVAAAPAPVPAPAAETTARERESAERREATVARMAAPQAAPTAAPAAPSADAAAAGTLAGRAAAAAAPAASAFIETPGLSNLRFEIRRQPESWSWQRDDGPARPMDDPMFEWIVQADRTARPSWQAGAVGADQATTTLRFTRGGVVRAVLRLGPGGMRLTRGGKTESVELSRGQMAALQSSLDALGP